MSKQEIPDSIEPVTLFVNEIKKLDNNDQLSLAIDKAIERMREYDEPITNPNIKNWIINLISERLNMPVPEDDEDPTRLQEYNFIERELFQNIVEQRRILPMKTRKTFGQNGTSYAEHSDPEKED